MGNSNFIKVADFQVSGELISVSFVDDAYGYCEPQEREHLLLATFVWNKTTFVSGKKSWFPAILLVPRILGTNQNAREAVILRWSLAKARGLSGSDSV